jgi:hypothetical protein
MKQIISGIWNASPLDIYLSLLIICIVLAAILFAFLYWVNR